MILVKDTGIFDETLCEAAAHFSRVIFALSFFLASFPVHFGDYQPFFYLLPVSKRLFVRHKEWVYG